MLYGKQQSGLPSAQSQEGDQLDSIWTSMEYVFIMACPHWPRRGVSVRCTLWVTYGVCLSTLGAPGGGCQSTLEGMCFTRPEKQTEIISMS